MTYKEMLERQKLIKLLEEEGRSDSGIALKLGISRQRVYQIKSKVYFKPRKILCLMCSKSITIFNKGRKFCDDCSSINASMQGRERTRELVRSRDKHTCRKCGRRWDESMRRFDVHHLNGFCGKKSRSYDKVKDMKGLITYCHRCHMGLHEVRKKISNKSSPRFK